MDDKKIFFFLAIFLLSACQTVASPTGEVTAITTTPTWTPAPTRTSSPTPTYTSVPLSKLLSDENYALIEELLTTNGGCRLPCFWGITPGETRWEDAERFLQTFTIVHPRFGSDEEFRVFVQFVVPQQHSALDHTFFVKEGIVDSITANISYATTFGMPALLEEYGKPDEVYGSSFYNHDQYFYQVLIDLIYWEQGIYTGYYVIGEEIGEEVQGCFGKKDIPGPMYLWPSNEELTEERKEKVSVIVDYSTAIEMDAETFYQTFKGIEGEECISVPK